MKDKKYIIAIDGGSQSSKVIVFDLLGNAVCEGKCALRPMHMPAPGIVEHPDDDLWDSIAAASRMAMDNFEGNRQDIVGVGLCTIRCCRTLLNKDGSLAAPAINWMDERLARPYEHTNPDVAYVTTTSGYITQRFTGNFADTAANYLGEWPIDYDAWDWSNDPAVLARYRVPREMLFDLYMPGSIVGVVTKEASAVTGIPEELPVAVTANDKAVEALGAGLSGEHALISLGTYICGMAIGKANAQGADFFTNMASVPGQYLYESGGIRRGMWTVSWLKDLLGEDVAIEARERGISPEEVLNREAACVPAGSEGLLTVLDWLAPSSTPYKRGVLLGFSARHTRAHMYRSILEAIVLTMKNHVDAMSAELDRPFDTVIVSGGGSNSDVLMQIFADVFDRPAVRNVLNGAAALGAAICAAVGVGAYDSFETAANHMVRIRDTFTPDPGRAALYDRLNREVYRDMTRYTDEILQKSHAIFNEQ